ncbi:MAG: hypothetical protein COA32_01980 [Fluviicola sp.]|nr:MAG: hypothetical protein COA32_01980 [Fluviicola sp.]
MYSNIDSLRNVFNSSNVDTVKLISAKALSANYEQKNPDSSVYFGKQALEIANKLDRPADKVSALLKIGTGHYFARDYNQTIEECNKALVLSKKIKDTIYQGTILYYLSRAYSRIARYDLTIQIQLDAIRFYEERNHAAAIGVMYNNMSIAYKYLGDFREAIEALKIASKNYKKAKSKENYFSPYTNIAACYFEMEEYDSCLIYVDSAKIMVKKYNKPNAETMLNHMQIWEGEIAYERGSYEKALGHYKISHEANMESYEIDDQIYSQLGIGRSLLKLGRPKEAKPYLVEVLEKAKESNALKRVMMGHEALAELYNELGDFKKSTYHLKHQIELSDSIFNQEKTMAIMSARTAFDVENKEKEIRMLSMKNELGEKNARLQEAELEQTKSRQILLYSILAFTLVFIIGLFVLIKKRNKTNRLLKRQKNEISEQKEVLQIKNKEILDSIQYAKRIQTAILPPGKLVRSYLEDSFILYKPKDVVAGDFYWMESFNNAPLNQKKTEKSAEDTILFAAADCTGHGVPGAMVSVICNNGLNRAVREYGITDPGKILDKTREIVIQEFEKSDEEMKDGMDISLVSLRSDKNRSFIEWAGANNPLWIIRKSEIKPEDLQMNGGSSEKIIVQNHEGYSLVEIKPDKQPIGQYDNPKPYTTHRLELKKEDTIYVFTDGYPDQFGGEHNKKLKTTNFKKLLLSINDKTMDEQKSIIDKSFEDWKGGFEQVDDVCVIGVRL